MHLYLIRHIDWKHRLEADRRFPYFMAVAQSPQMLFDALDAHFNPFVLEYRESDDIGYYPMVAAGARVDPEPGDDEPLIDAFVERPDWMTAHMGVAFDDALVSEDGWQRFTDADMDSVYPGLSDNAAVRAMAGLQKSGE